MTKMRSEWTIFKFQLFYILKSLFALFKRYSLHRRLVQIWMYFCAACISDNVGLIISKF